MKRVMQETCYVKFWKTQRKLSAMDSFLGKNAALDIAQTNLTKEKQIFIH